MPPNPAQYPMINGKRFDFSSAEITVAGLVYNGFKSINYKHKLTPGTMRGNHAAPIGRTRGTYDVESCNGEMWKSDYQRLVNALRTAFPQLGYMEAEFPIVVNYSEPTSEGIVTDDLQGARIMSDEHGGAEGSDPLVVKVEFHVMRLIVDGQPASTNKGFLTPTG